jgi:SPP1 family predicted phage head-tail adaptor
MWFNEVIELGTVTETVTNGEPIKTYAYRTVYADKQSVGGKEVYEGMSVGVKPDLRFIIKAFEYAGEEKVRYNSKLYTVIREFTQGDTTELYVTKVVE